MTHASLELNVTSTSPHDLHSLCLQGKITPSLFLTLPDPQVHKLSCKSCVYCTMVYYCKPITILFFALFNATNPRQNEHRQWESSRVIHPKHASILGNERMSSIRKTLLWQYEVAYTSFTWCYCGYVYFYQVAELVIGWLMSTDSQCKKSNARDKQPIHWPKVKVPRRYCPDLQDTPMPFQTAIPLTTQHTTIPIQYRIVQQTTDCRSEWKLPLRGWITCRHCR